MKNYIIIALMPMFLCGCQYNQTQQETKPDGNSKKIESNSTKITLGEETSWFYIPIIDDLTGGVITERAMIVSTNAVDYDNKGHKARLMIALSYGYINALKKIKTQIMWGVAEDEWGEFQISSVQGQGILARFDEGPVDDTWALVDCFDTPNGRKALSLFLSDEKIADFITKVKQSKRCRIQLNLEKVGNKTFEFNTEGLQWDY